VRWYTSYIAYYVHNINKYYNDALIIIVDNESTYQEDVFAQFRSVGNVVILVNTTEHKFEAGAYLLGINFILDNKLEDKYNYFVFTQDTYILKNPYDFNELLSHDIKACPLSFGDGIQDFSIQTIKPMLISMNLWSEHTKVNKVSLRYFNVNIQNKILQCFCNSFIIHNSKIIDLHSCLSSIKITSRLDSEICERVFAWMLYKLNNDKNYQIDINPYTKYSSFTVNPFNNFKHGYFVKKMQHKTEHTKDDI